MEKTNTFYELGTFVARIIHMFSNLSRVTRVTCFFVFFFYEYIFADVVRTHADHFSTFPMVFARFQKHPLWGNYQEGTTRTLFYVRTNIVKTFPVARPYNGFFKGLLKNQIRQIIVLHFYSKLINNTSTVLHRNISKTLSPKRYIEHTSSY